MKTYIEIVFFQGSEADEPLDILEVKGEEACMEYCKQWDYGDGFYESPAIPWGSDDDLFQDGAYILAYNTKLGYVGLCRVENVENTEEA